MPTPEEEAAAYLAKHGGAAVDPQAEAKAYLDRHAAAVAAPKIDLDRIAYVPDKEVEIGGAETRVADSPDPPKPFGVSLVKAMTGFDPSGPAAVGTRAVLGFGNNLIRNAADTAHAITHPSKLLPGPRLPGLKGDDLAFKRPGEYEGSDFQRDPIGSTLDKASGTKAAESFRAATGKAGDVAESVGEVAGGVAPFFIGGGKGGKPPAEPTVRLYRGTGREVPAWEKAAFPDMEGTKGRWFTDDPKVAAEVYNKHPEGPQYVDVPKSVAEKARRGKGPDGEGEFVLPREWAFGESVLSGGRTKVASPEAVESAPVRDPLIERRGRAREGLDRAYNDAYYDTLRKSNVGLAGHGEATAEQRAAAQAAGEKARERFVSKMEPGPLRDEAERAVFGPAAKPPASQRGAVNLGDVGPAVAKGTRSVFGRETSKVADLETPSAVDLSKRLEQAADVSRREAGPLQEDENAVVSAARFNPKARRALGSVYVTGKNYALPQAEEVIAGRAQTASPTEQKIADALQNLVDKRGKAFERMGFTREDPQTGQPVPFVAAKGVLPRVMHPEGIAVMERGSGDRAWGVLVDSIADANGIPRAKVEATLEDMRSDLLDLPGRGGTYKGTRTQAEFFRQWQKMPSEIRVPMPGGSRTVKILETDPIDYAKALVRQGTARMGVVEAFGQDPDALNAMRSKFISENSGKGFDAGEMFDRQLRMAHGHAPQPALISPSHPAAPLIKGVNEILSWIKTGMLSTRAAVNTGEYLGSVRDLTGTSGLGKAVKSAMTPGATKALEDIGAVTKEMFEGWDGTVKGLSRALRTGADRLTLGPQMEGAQEVLAGHGAKVAGERMRARAGGPASTFEAERDVQRLKGLGYKPADARRLAYGGGTTAEYQTLLRTAAPRVTGANVTGPELSTWENARLPRNLFWFQRYAQMNARDGFRKTAAFLDGIKDAFATGLSGADRARRVGASIAQYADWAIGKTVSQAAGVAVGQLVTGGTMGLKAYAADAQENLGKFAIKNFLFGVFGGPYAAVLRSSGIGGGTKPEIIDAMALPSLVKTTTDIIQGDGRYTDMDASQKVGAFLDRIVAMKRVFTKGIPSLFGDEGAKEKVAQSAYWRWRMETPLWDDRDKGDPQPSPYRAEIKRMIEALEKGDTDEAERLYRSASGLRTSGRQHDIEQYVTDRLFLTGRNKADDAKLRPLLPDLRAHVGEDAYSELVKRDQRLLDFIKRTRK